MIATEARILCILQALDGLNFNPDLLLNDRVVNSSVIVYVKEMSHGRRRYRTSVMIEIFEEINEAKRCPSVSFKFSYQDTGKVFEYEGEQTEGTKKQKNSTNKHGLRRNWSDRDWTNEVTKHAHAHTHTHTGIGERERKR